MNWDKYFHDICETIASKSPCLSRKIGAILVKDNSIISTGYNGPPRGCVHCGADRTLLEQGTLGLLADLNICPRKLERFKSGEGLHLCPAVHAEMNAVIDAARKGASTLGSTLYMNCVIPCKQCMGILINAGVKEIVVDDDSNYDGLTYLLRTSPMYPIIRTFNFGESNG